MKIALFDFDGTITTKDSLSDFIQYALGKKAYYKGLLALLPSLIAYKLKLIPNNVAKERLISHFFKNWDSADFQKIADRYSIKKIDKIIRPHAIKMILWHQQQGHQVIIVSASIENWLKKWCKKNHIKLIATRLEVQNGKITGRFSTNNCYGKEKLIRIKRHYNLSKCEYIYAYGDSQGDKEMLSIANKACYKPFR